jgi:AraC family L-rhamnose operon transcriptional activator RhaR/AraC family L-rhamnose operon regulatory protein RhaS
VKHKSLSTDIVYHWNRLHPEKDLPLNVVMVKDDLAAAPLHSHDFVELLLVVSGTSCYHSPFGEWQLEAGDVFLIHPGQIHGFSNSKHLAVYNVLWSPDELRFDFSEVSRLPGYQLFFQSGSGSQGQNRFPQHSRLNQEQLGRAKSLIEQILEELNFRKDGYQPAVYSLLRLLFILICRQTGEPDQASRRRPESITNVIRFMEKNYAKELDRANLARMAHMSGATFFRHFRRATGLSPMEFLQNSRLAQAETLLRTTLLPLAEISDRCGFCDSNYFILCFRKRYNITPYRYRKLFQSSPTVIL